MSYPFPVPTSKKVMIGMEKPLSVFIDSKITIDLIIMITWHIILLLTHLFGQGHPS